MKKVILICILICSYNIVAAQFIPINRNPKFSTDINPKYAKKTNPTFTTDINPKYSYKINPKFTTDINPKWTTSINPKFTTDISPKWNTKLNPKFNFQLNPKYNSWDGFYIFNKDAELTGYAVKGSDDVYLHFNTADVWLGYFVKASTNMNYFTLEDEWTGEYLCSDNNGGYNWFNENGEWKEDYLR